MSYKTNSWQTADIAIVGGGVIGLSLARSLALRGMRNVIVIERSGFGSESSSAAAGMLAPQAEADHADDFFRICCQSRDMYQAFAESLRNESGIDVELDQSGTLYLALTEADEEEISERYKWQSQAGLRVENLSGEETRMFEPALSSHVRAALRFPLDVQVENRRLVRALVESNKQFGVSLISGTTVTSIKIERDAIKGLETSHGFVDTHRVVLAAGAWTSAQLPAHPTLAALSIEPVRGQMVCFESNGRLASHVVYSPRGYIVPRADGRILAGSTSEFAGFDKRVTGEGIHSILSRALEISPRVASLPVVDTWAGLRPRAPDNLPVLGPCAEIEGLFYATGHYRNGILLAPITGELMAEAIVNKTIPPIMAPFSPDRFAIQNRER